MARFDTDKPLPSISDLKRRVLEDAGTIISKPETKPTIGNRGLKSQSTIKELAEEFSVSSQTITRRMKKQGYDTRQKTWGVDKKFSTKTQKFNKAMQGLQTDRERNIKDYLDLGNIHISYKTILNLFGFETLDAAYDLQLFKDIQDIYVGTGIITQDAKTILSLISEEYKPALEAFIASNY